MKRKFTMIAMLCMIITMFCGMSTVAFAAETTDVAVTATAINDYLTWDMLASFAGMVIAVTVLTQVLKGLPFKFNATIDPKWYSLVLAIILGCAVQFIYKSDFTAQGIFMMAINCLVVYASSIGGYETIIKPVQRYLEAKKQ